MGKESSVYERRAKRQARRGVDVQAEARNVSPTKKKKKRNYKEHKEQAKLAGFLDQMHPEIVYFAIPNGGYRTPAEATRLKAEGVKAGVPDLFIAHPITDHTTMTFLTAGLFIEMKTEDTRSNTSPEQDAMHEKLADYEIEICASAREAMEAIYDYLDYPGHKRHLDKI